MTIVAEPHSSQFELILLIINIVNMAHNSLKTNIKNKKSPTNTRNQSTDINAQCVSAQLNQLSGVASVVMVRRLDHSKTVRTIEMKQKQNFFKTVLKLFCSTFDSVSFQLCGQLIPGFQPYVSVHSYPFSVTVSVTPFLKRRCRSRHIGEWPGWPSSW